MVAKVERWMEMDELGWSLRMCLEMAGKRVLEQTRLRIELALIPKLMY